MNVMSKGRRSADGEIRFPKGIVFVLSAALWGAGCGNDLIHEGGWTEMAAGGPPTIAAELAGDLPEPPYPVSYTHLQWS